MQVKNIKLNFKEDYCAFYDWLSSDDIGKYNNVILEKVSSKVISDFINYNIKIKGDIRENIPYIFTDSFSYIALIFNEEGVSTKVSTLLLTDEEKLKHRVDNLRICKIEYEKLTKRNVNTNLRYFENIKKEIITEINHLKQNKEIDKLKYLYYEWFGQNEESISRIVDKMLEKVSMPLTNQEKYIYDLILTTHKVV